MTLERLPLEPWRVQWEHATQRAVHLSPDQFRKQLPVLNQLGATDEMIRRAEALLMNQLAQERICGTCQGYEQCGKLGDAQGMYDGLTTYADELVVQTSYCKPFRDFMAVKKAARFQVFSSRTTYDRSFTFESFPEQQRRKRPKLVTAAETFAREFQVGQDVKGFYIFGPAGVGKTHLLHAMVNVLEQRSVPCIFVQAEALFDRIRSLIGEGKDLEPTLDAFSSVPVLALDEIGQERANEFTLEKLFRIINQRFASRLPTLFASNYMPFALYRRLPEDLLPIVDPLKSRIIGMTRVGDLDGDDFRIASAELLDV